MKPTKVGRGWIMNLKYIVGGMVKEPMSAFELSIHF